MGAKDALLVFTDGDAAEVLRARPALDREAALGVARRLYPQAEVTLLADGTLGANSLPEEGEIYVAGFPGLTIVSILESAGDYPSRTPLVMRGAVATRFAYAHSMHSAVDWFAYAIWDDARLVRALSLAPEDGIIENVGPPLPFERPYWAGEFPVEVDEGEKPYPFPFHPLDLGEAALRELLGFTFEGPVRDDDPDPWDIPMAGFRIA
jgi:hypothetical protein